MTSEVQDVGVLVLAGHSPGFERGPEHVGGHGRRVSCSGVTCSDLCFQEGSGCCAENGFSHVMLQMHLKIE